MWRGCFFFKCQTQQTPDKHCRVEKYRGKIKVTEITGTSRGTWSGTGAARPYIFNLRTFRQPCRGINTYNHPRLAVVHYCWRPPLTLTYISAASGWEPTTPVETCHRVKYRKRPRGSGGGGEKNAGTRCRCAEWGHPRETSRGPTRVQRNVSR